MQAALAKRFLYRCEQREVSNGPMGGLCVNGTLQVLWPGKGLEMLLSNASSDFCFIWATERDREKRLEK